MLKIIDRYILSELVGPFLFGVATFSFILAGGTVIFPLISEALKYNIPLVKVLQLFVFKLPFIIVWTFPMATLFTSLIVFGRLNSDLEILAFRAGGINFNRIVTPVIFAGLLISVITILMNEAIVPKTNNSAENLFRSYRNQTKPTIKENINFTELKEGQLARIINVQKVNEGILTNITIAEYEDNILQRLIKAKTGKWRPEGKWEFNNGRMYKFFENDLNKITLIQFDQEIIDIKINPFDVNKRKKNVEEMTSKELKERIRLLESTGKNAIKERMDYHIKLAVPFASVIFSILGSAVGLRHHRGSSALGLGISLIIILVYYLLIAVSTGLGLSETLPPYIAAWIPNFLVGSIGIYRLSAAAVK